MTTFNSFRDYFAAIVADSFALLGYQVNTFGHGDSDRIVAMLRSEIEYPILWAERPNYSMEWREGYYENVDVAIAVLYGVAKDETVLQDNAVNNAQLILMQLQNKMRTDGYQFTKADIEPIEKTMADNGYGARMTLTINNLPTTFLCP